MSVDHTGRIKWIKSLVRVGGGSCLLNIVLTIIVKLPVTVKPAPVEY